MAATRRIALHGLAFGDCGKGLFTDALCHRWQAHTVVRFNGGAQAGHNVVLPDGRHHTFAQFGAGSFQPGVASVLAQAVVVHPGALQVEAACLAQKGLADALDRLLIDRRCRINTPFHQAAGRLRELRRGAGAHGSCGVGVGETVRHGLAHADEVLHYGELRQAARTRERLEAIRQRLCREFAADDFADARAKVELALLADPTISQRWLDSISGLLERVPAADPELIGTRLRRPGTVIFEGAQGALLDEAHGFHPHTTWSRIHREAAQGVLADAGIDEPMQHFGVLRSYLTRHGAGPLPTETAELDGLAEPHNTHAGWQGRFRRGHPDALLLRYAIEVLGGLDGVLLSHLDVFAAIGGLRWCDGYRARPAADDARLCRRQAGDPQVVRRLLVDAGGDLAHAAGLAGLLDGVQPIYAAKPIRGADELIERVRSVTSCPVAFASFGPSRDALREIP